MNAPKPRGPLTPPAINAAWVCFACALAMPLIAACLARGEHKELDRLGTFIQLVVFFGGPLALAGIVFTIIGARRWPRNAVTMGAIYLAAALAILGLAAVAFVAYIS